MSSFNKTIKWQFKTIKEIITEIITQQIIVLCHSLGERFPVLGQFPPRKIALNPKTNPKPNPNANRGAILLGGNCLVAPPPPTLKLTLTWTRTSTLTGGQLSGYCFQANPLITKSGTLKCGTHLGLNFFSTFNTSGNMMLKMQKHFYRFQDCVLVMKNF